jgi:Tfp pilus assembly protein PilF
VNLGATLLAEKENKKAKEALRRALEINPKSVHATFNLGAAYMAMGDYGDAEIAFQAVLKFDPSNAEAKRALEQIAKVRKSNR